MAEGCIQGNTCWVTIDTGASVTIARRDIFAGQPERKPSRTYAFQTASGEIVPVLKEVLVELNLERQALRIWMFVAEVMDEFILGLDVLRAYDASVDLGRCLLRLGQEEVTLWRPSAQRKSARHSLVGDEVIPAPCERMVIVRLQASLGANNVLIEPGQRSSRDKVPAVWAAAIGDQKPGPRRKPGRCKQRAYGRRVRIVAAAAANG